MMSLPKHADQTRVSAVEVEDDSDVDEFRVAERLEIEKKDSTSLGFLGRKNHNWGSLCYQGDRKRGKKYQVVSTNIVLGKVKRESLRKN